LVAPFPDEALAPVKRGNNFYLTTIKAQYVISRLNEVFGPCGIGWKFTSSFENFSSKYIICYLELSVKVNGEWSEAIAGVGGHRISGELADAYKSARTDAITKASSKLGIGDPVFKGLVNPLDLIKRDAKLRSKSNSISRSRAKPKEVGKTSVSSKKAVKNITKKNSDSIKVDTATGEIVEDEVELIEAKKKYWEIVKASGKNKTDAKNYLLKNYKIGDIKEVNLDILNDAINTLRPPATET